MHIVNSKINQETQKITQAVHLITEIKNKIELKLVVRKCTE